MAAKPAKRIRIKVRVILQDIKAGISSEALRQKYGLSQRSLEKVIGALLQKELVTLEDLASLLVKKVAPTKTVNAQYFLASFRECPDDFFLMKEFSINPKQLQKIYDTLIERRELSEYEYYARERKAPELEESEQNESEDSTLVNLYEDVTGALGDYVMEDRCRSEQELTSTSPFVTSVASLNIGYSSNNANKSNGSSASKCPNCSKPRTMETDDTCAYCGILYSKYDKTQRSKGVAIWRDINSREIE